MHIFIKNMVCNRCIMVVGQEMEKLKLIPEQVLMGEVILKEQPTENQLQALNKRLNELGFELLNTQQQKQIEQVKSLIIHKVQSGGIEEHFSLSDFLGKSFNKDYGSISRLFSETEGITIEQYFIQQKIEKVKELLVYGEQNLSEISYQLGYSSVSHLSAQFKKITGLTPTAFKKTTINSRKSLDAL